MIGLTSACLAAFVMLSGCASALAKMEAPVGPPVQYMQECPHPEIRDETNGELVQTIVDYRDSLDRCNKDKSALRAWAESIKPKN